MANLWQQFLCVVLYHRYTWDVAHNANRAGFTTVSTEKCLRCGHIGDQRETFVAW